MSALVKQQGAVFTPPEVCREFARRIETTGGRLRLLEPACGTGNMLAFLDLSAHEVHVNDIDPGFVHECARRYPEVARATVSDFLCEEVHQGETYDVVFGNPPYVRIQNIQPDKREALKRKYDLLGGSFDLYMAFVLKALDMADRVVFIIPNAWIYNVSGRAFCRYILANRFLRHLTDFGDRKVFKDIGTYTCIVELDKREKDSFEFSTSLGGPVRRVPFEGVDPSNLPDALYGQVPVGPMDRRLSDLITVRNGLATLADGVFVIKEWGEVQGDASKILVRGFEVERAACRTVLKVSKKRGSLVVFPYHADGRLMEDFEARFPGATAYLRSHASVLESRDRGNKRYEAWYAYGRKQSTTIDAEPRVYVSSLCKDSIDAYVCETELFYSGLRVTSDVLDNDAIVKFLGDHSEAILRRSSKRSNGWSALSQSSFAVPLG
jgi:adenine-specific DNA-methyltransferase